MHQLGKNTIGNIKANFNSLKKFSRSNKIQDQKIQGWIPQEQIKQTKATESILSKMKKRTFSLSKLQSVQQSDLAQQMATNSINNIRKNPDKLRIINSQIHQNITENVKSVSEKVIFQKLNFNSSQQQNKHVVSINFRRSTQRNPFFPKQDSTKEQSQISLLKQILKKKEQDLILNKSKQNQKLQSKNQGSTKQHLQPQKVAEQAPQSSSAIKRIKLLRKTKQYEYYDNIVYNLLTNLQKSNNQSDQNSKQNKISNEQQLMIASIKSKSFSNLNTTSTKPPSNSIKNDCIKTSFGTNFSSTYSQINSQMNLTNSTKNSVLSNKKKQTMIFRLSQLTCDNIYEKKISSFIQFLYKVNLSNSIYVDLSLSNKNNRTSIKVFVGRGNNSELIKSVVKRRFWIQLTSTKSEANILWTQDTQKEIHSSQLHIRSKQSKHQKQDLTSNNHSRKSNYTLKRKFTSSTYGSQSNSKILNQKEIQQANAAFQRSYLGLKSNYPQVNVQVVTNHIPNNSVIGSKKILFKLMHWYYSNMQKINPFTILPHTYHIVPGQKDNQGIKKFKQQQLHKTDRIWIVKPGQNTNRGNGISVATTNQIQRLMRYKKFHKNGELKTFIVQKYLKPFLYNNRKFDIRHYLLITSVNGIVKGYWYNSGYIRTSSQKFDLDELDNQFVHLTNDAIQKNSQNYGKYEEGNKLSYSTFQRYLDNNLPHKKYDFQKQILSQMKKITTDVLRASFMFLDPDRNQRLLKGKGTNFQLYGMDFMIDHKFKPYLIQINANPCLEISCPLLQRIIPIAIQHTFRLALDPLFPPTQHYSPSKRYQLCDRILDRLKFELIFDEKNEGKQLRKKYKTCENKFQLNGVQLQPEEDIFQDDGEEIKDEAVFEEGNKD